jgi:hypothetical protein
VAGVRKLIAALLSALALALAAGATPAAAQDLIEYALMADVPADTGAQPGPDGADHLTTNGDSLLLGAGIDSRASYDRGDATGLDHAVSRLLGADIDFGADHARERDVETGLDYGESALVATGIDFWMDDARVDVVDSY